MTLAPARPVPDPGTRAGIASVARGGLANLVGAAVAGVSGFGVTWLVARSLGPSQAGAFFAATAAFLLAGTVAKLGTQTGLVYFVARLRAGGASGGALRDCLRVAIVPVLVAAAGCAVALWYAAPWLARITTRDGAHGYVAQLRVLALLLPVGVVSDTLLAASRGWRTMRPTVVIDRILRPGAQVLLLAGFALAAIGSPPAYTLGWAVPYLGSALLAGYVLHRLLQIYHPVHPKPRPYGRPRQSTVDRRRFWGFTGPRALASVAQLAAQRVDVLLLASLAGLRAAAVYAVAGRFIVLGQFANQAISQAVQPRLAELSAGEDRHGAAALYKTATGWLVLAAWPLYLGIAVYPPVYLGLFGPGFAGAHRVVVVLALAMLVATGCGMVDMVLSMAGRTSWNLANVVTALGVNLGVDLLLIPHLGALGAAIGLAAATLTNNLVPLAQIAIVLRLHPFGRGTLTAATLALACFGAIPLLVRVVAGPGILSAAASGMLGLAAYLTGAYHLRKTLALDAFLTLRAPMKRSKR